MLHVDEKTDWKEGYKQSQINWSYSHHGLSKMNEASSFSIWAFWLFLTIVLQIPMIWNIHNSIVAFGKYDVATHYKMEFRSTPSLPVVTICPKAPFKKAPFLELINFYKRNKDDPSWNRYPKEALEYLNTVILYLEGGTGNAFVRPEAFLYHLFHFDPDWRERISWTCQDLFSYVAFVTEKEQILLGDPKDICEDVDVVAHAFHGRCFRLNQNQKAIALFSGPDAGIRVALKTNGSDYLDVFDYFSIWSGFKVVLSGPEKELRVMENGKDIGMAQAVQIGLKKRELHKEAKWPWSDCMMEYPDQLKNFAALLKKKTYSKNSCEQICLLQRTKLRHGCIIFQFEDLVPLGKTFKEPSCNYTYYVSGIQNEQFACDQICRTRCDSESWTQDVVSEFLPPILEVDKYARLANEMGLAKNSFLTLNIFYSDLEVTIVTEEPAKTPEGLIGDIGGQLGLWCGMSIMTIFELIILAYICCRKRGKADFSTEDEKYQDIFKQN